MPQIAKLYHILYKEGSISLFSKRVLPVYDLFPQKPKEPIKFISFHLLEDVEII